jgi:DNA-binding CsgD family transcriptional regulator
VHSGSGGHFVAIYARHDLDQERQALVMHRTWELAMSGLQRNADDIAGVLIAEGYTDADQWLKPALVRERINDVCERSQQARQRALPDPHRPPELGDEAAIWHVIETEFAAFWSRDFATYEKCILNTPDYRFQASVRDEGLTLRQGWEEQARRVRQDMERDPIPNPFYAFETRIEARRLHIARNMAWCTCEAAFPTADLPGFRGPGRQNETRILVRQDGQWKTTFHSFDNLNFGQTDAPLWEVDEQGMMIWQNPAATMYLEQDDPQIIVSGRRLRMRDTAAQVRLGEALRVVADLDYGYLSRRRSMPVVVDAGYDEAASVWWVVAENGKLTVTRNVDQLLLARLDTASTVFALSPAQRRLAVALVKGLSLADAAASDGIGLSTAKTQLQRIFDKVGVRTQPALVRALLLASERN